MSDTNIGWVYIIVNDLIQGRIKIGFTLRDPLERAKEMASTGLTGTLVVIYQACVRDPYRVEREVHRRFYKDNCGGEWFTVCPNRAKEVIRAVAGEMLLELTEPRWHGDEPSARTKELLKEAEEAARRERERLAEETILAAIEAERRRQEQEEVAAIAKKEAEEARRRADEEAARKRDTERAQREKRHRERTLASFIVAVLFLGALVAVYVLDTVSRPHSPDQRPALRSALEKAGSSAESVGKNEPSMSLFPGSAIAAWAVRSGWARQGVGCETARIF